MRTYNDFIQHYMKTELDPRIPQVVDKLGLKEYAKTKGVATPKTLSRGKELSDVLKKMMVIPDKFMVKNNADSGGYIKVRRNKLTKHVELFGGRGLNRLTKHMFTPYSLDKGEWAYGPILPMLFAEEYLADNITDYKFHCHNGKVMFCQYIFDRTPTLLKSVSSFLIRLY